MSAPTADWSVIIERLEKLERQNLRMKQVGIVALVLAAAVVLMGQAPANRIVEAERFVLKDKGGNVRGSLAIFADGPGLELYDANQKLRVALGVLGDMPNLTLKDGKEVGRVMLGIVPTGPGLVLADDRGKFRAQLDVGTEGPRLFLEDQKGFGASIGNYYSPTKKSAETSAASVVLFDKDGKVLWEAP